jgi:hypothetical protein
MTKDTISIEGNSPQALSWKEKYSSFLLLLLGIVYLVLWLISFLSETSGPVKLEGDKLTMSRSELLNHTRTFLTIAFSIPGSLLLLKRHRIGWILGLPVYLVFLGIVSGGVYQAVILREPVFIMIAAIGWIILFVGLIFLILKHARTIFRVTRFALATTLLLAGLLAAFYFVFQ